MTIKTLAMSALRFSLSPFYFSLSPWPQGQQSLCDYNRSHTQDDTDIVEGRDEGRKEILSLLLIPLIKPTLNSVSTLDFTVTWVNKILT